MKVMPVLACAAGLWSVAAFGQSIDPTGARATIGDPIDLEVQVRTTPELGAARLGRSCVQAQVLDGQRLIDDDALAIDIGPASDDGLNRLHIRHASLVGEPVVHARVTLTCGANYTREFTVLPRDRTEPTTRAPRSSATRLGLRRTAHSSNPPRPGREQTSSQSASTPTLLADSKTPVTSSPADSRTAPEPRIGGGDVEALARSVLRLFQAAGLDLQRSSQGLLDPRQSDPAVSLAAADSKFLLQEVQRLRSESQQSATAIASLHARVERAESDRWLPASWAVLAVIAGLVTLAAAMRVADLAAPLLLRRFSRRTRDAVGQAKQSSSIEQYLSDIGARPPAKATTTVIDRAATPTAATAPEHMALAFEDAQLPAAEAAIAVQMKAAAPIVPLNAPKAHANRWAHAEFGPASLDHRRVRKHRGDIDKAVRDGYLGFALVMLEQLLHSGEGKHPWVLLRLLDVYRQLRQQDNHERVCAEIEALYNIRVPSYDAEQFDVDACETLDQLDEWPALRLAWSCDLASPLIASCLLRGDRQVDRDPATFADLLFLHELAEIREAPPEVDSVPV
jgi:hypothetical protein